MTDALCHLSSSRSCLVCLFDRDAEDGNEHSDFLPCPRCGDLLYCSDACAEIGWFAHRPFCSAAPPPLYASVLSDRTRQLHDHLAEVLRHVTESSTTDSYDAKSLLDVMKTQEELQRLGAPQTNEALIPLLVSAIDVLGKVDTGALVAEKGALYLTHRILFRVRLMSASLGDHDEALHTLREGLAWLELHKLFHAVIDCGTLLAEERGNVWSRKYPNIVLSINVPPAASQSIRCGGEVAREAVPLFEWMGIGCPPALTPRQGSTYDITLRAMRDAFLTFLRTHNDFMDDGKNDKETISATEINDISEANVVNAAHLFLYGMPKVRQASAEFVVAAESHLRLLCASRESTRCIHSLISAAWLVDIFASALLSSRSCGTEQWGFFDAVSRVPHSCTPNCVWDPDSRVLRAIRDIAAYTPLTLTTLWGTPASMLHQMMLKLPAHIRKESVRNITGHLCSCERCVGGANHQFDSLRGFPCPICKDDDKGWRYKFLQGKSMTEDLPRIANAACAEAATTEGNTQEMSSNEREKTVTKTTQKIDKEIEENRLALQRFFEPSETWCCMHCGERWRDAEMPLEKERELCRKGERLVTMTQRGIVGRGLFEEMKTLVEDTLQVMGRQHHASYLFACEAFICFYRYISSRFAPPTGVLAQEYILMWCRKWIRCAENTKLMEDCPHICAAFIIETALSLTNASLFREKVILLRHAEFRCQIATIYGVSDSRVKAVAAILYDRASPQYTTKALSKSDFTSFMNTEERDGNEDALISSWEEHLIDRVHSEIHSNEHPNLPPKLAQAFRRDKSK